MTLRCNSLLISLLSLLLLHSAGKPLSVYGSSLIVHVVMFFVKLWQVMSRVYCSMSELCRLEVLTCVNMCLG